MTLTTPKPLLEIQGKKILDYVFDALPDEVDEVIVTVKHLAEKIKSYLGESHKGRKVRYVQGSEQGSAIGLLACQEFLQDGERFFILHGDEPQRKAELTKCLKHQYSWVCSYVPKLHPTGVATIAPDGKILEVAERPEHPQSNWSAMGTILVDANIFKYSPVAHVSGEYPLSPLLNQFVKDHKVYMVEGNLRPPLMYLDDLNWDMKDFQESK